MREETLGRLGALGFPIYEAYIRSDLWRANKARLGVLRPRKCSICPSKVRLHAHHVSYDRVGAEQPGDLIVACSRCHEEIHKLVNKGMPLIRAHIVYAERLRGVKSKPRRKKTKSKKSLISEAQPYVQQKVKPLRSEAEVERLKQQKRRQASARTAPQQQKVNLNDGLTKGQRLKVDRMKRYDLVAAERFRSDCLRRKRLKAESDQA